MTYKKKQENVNNYLRKKQCIDANINITQFL